MFEILVFGGLVYVLVDLVSGLVLGRCVVPGLRCRACRLTKDQ